MKGLQFLGRFQRVLNGRPIQPVSFQIRFKKVSASGKFSSPSPSKPALCPLRDSETNKQILLSESDGSLLDTLSRQVLRENIQVPVLSLTYERKIPLNNLESLNLKQRFKDMPKEIKHGKFSPLENKIILKNLESLFLKAELPVENLGEIFRDSIPAEHLDLDKANVIDHYLSQDLGNLRLACEVFQRARSLTVRKVRRGFTAEEDKFILEFMTGEGLNLPRPWAELSTKLGKPRNSIYNRYKNIIRYQDKEKERRYDKDIEIIMNMLFVSNRNVFLDGKVNTSVWEDLAKMIKRKPYKIRYQWLTIIEPVISRFQAGTLDQDYTEDLIRHMVENNLSYSQDVQWAEIAQLSKFRGVSNYFLQNKFSTVRANTRKKYPELSEAEVTSQVILKYLETRDKKVKYRNKISREEAIISCYENLVANKMD